MTLKGFLEATRDETVLHLYFGDTDLCGFSLPGHEAKKLRIDAEIRYIFCEHNAIGVRISGKTLHPLCPLENLDRFEKAMVAFYA